MTDDAAAVTVAGYYQLKAELQVALQRIMKDAKDEILARLDQAETERREERRDFDARTRALEERCPRDLPEQLLRLHDQASQGRARTTLVLWMIPLILTAAGVAVGLMKP